MSPGRTDDPRMAVWLCEHCQAHPRPGWNGKLVVNASVLRSNREQRVARPDDGRLIVPPDEFFRGALR